MKKYQRATAADVFRMYRILWGDKLPERCDMKSKYFVTLQEGKITDTSDCSSPVELKDNQMSVTEKELAIIRICDGDLESAKDIISDIENRIRLQSLKG